MTSPYRDTQADHTSAIILQIATLVSMAMTMLLFRDWSLSKLLRRLSRTSNISNSGPISATNVFRRFYIYSSARSLLVRRDIPVRVNCCRTLIQKKRKGKTTIQPSCPGWRFGKHTANEIGLIHSIASIRLRRHLVLSISM